MHDTTSSSYSASDESSMLIVQLALNPQLGSEKAAARPIENDSGNYNMRLIASQGSVSLNFSDFSFSGRSP